MLALAGLTVFQVSLDLSSKTWRGGIGRQSIVGPLLRDYSKSITAINTHPE